MNWISVEEELPEGLGVHRDPNCVVRIQHKARPPFNGIARWYGEWCHPAPDNSGEYFPHFYATDITHYIEIDKIEPPTEKTA